MECDICETGSVTLNWEWARKMFASKSFLALQAGYRCKKDKVAKVIQFNILGQLRATFFRNMLTNFSEMHWESFVEICEENFTEIRLKKLRKSVKFFCGNPFGNLILGWGKNVTQQQEQ